MSADDETYTQWLARMWRVSTGLEPLRPEEQKLVAQHVLDNTGKVHQNDLTLYMLRNVQVPEALDERLDQSDIAARAADGIEAGAVLTIAQRNADGRHPQDLKAKAGRYMISG